MLSVYLTDFHVTSSSCTGRTYRDPEILFVLGPHCSMDYWKVRLRENRYCWSQVRRWTWILEKEHMGTSSDVENTRTRKTGPSFGGPPISVRQQGAKLVALDQTKHLHGTPRTDQHGQTSP